ncbi:MAG TPA: LLM class flavin-dependent oxidoreductase [Acidimicrobiales bacterium]|nr:LLM class flavin-dependent oxidoreductase [Acidimicrobiales bacterium]
MRFGLMSTASSWADACRDADLAGRFAFDSLCTGDHLRHPPGDVFPTLDGWSVLAGWAATTDRLRLGMMVSNIIYRHPVVVARQAVAVDEISGGRLDLGVGAGAYEADHAMAGTPAWSRAERVARLAEFVEALDLVLRGAEAYEGCYYRFSDAVVLPGPRQQPRPPVVVAAVSPRALRVAARCADVWSTFGGFGLDGHEVLARAAVQAATLEDHCAEAGRDPATLRRSLLALPQLAPWRSVGDFQRLLDGALRIGFDELVVFSPRQHELAVFEDVCTDVIPTHQGGR